MTPRFAMVKSTGATARNGGDFTTAGIVWQCRWGGKMSANAVKTK